MIRIFAGHVPKGEGEEAAVERAITGIKESLPLPRSSRGSRWRSRTTAGSPRGPSSCSRSSGASTPPTSASTWTRTTFGAKTPYADLAQLAPYAVNVQVKTEIAPQGKSPTEVDYARIIGLLRDAKYSGYIALEYEAKEDPMVAVPLALKKLRAAVNA